MSPLGFKDRVGCPSYSHCGGKRNVHSQRSTFGATQCWPLHIMPKDITVRQQWASNPRSSDHECYALTIRPNMFNSYVERRFIIPFRNNNSRSKVSPRIKITLSNRLRDNLPVVVFRSIPHPKHVWIGMYQTSGNNSDLKWMDGRTPFVFNDSSFYQPWKDGDPQGDDSHCMYLRESSGYLWADRRCSYLYWSVCESSSDPTGEFVMKSLE